jgi:hypothetical protein
MDASERLTQWQREAKPKEKIDTVASPQSQLPQGPDYAAEAAWSGFTSYYGYSKLIAGHGSSLLM